MDSIFTPQPPVEGYADYIGLPFILRPGQLTENARQRNDLFPQLAEMSPRFSEITQPIEIIHGDADDTVRVEIHAKPMVDILPRANLVVLPGIGHMPHHTNEEDVIAAIDRAVARAGLN